jgi:hypothetical protein
MSDADEPLIRNEANLAHLANRHAPDLFLLDLIQRSEVGGGLAVGLLVNGMIVLGRLASPMEMARAVSPTATIPRSARASAQRRRGGGRWPW